jgi:hypothetical protein
VLRLRLHVQEWIQGPLQTEQMFLQGTDNTGRALAIIRVAGHVADKKALKDMKLFVCYVMNAMVSCLYAMLCHECNGGNAAAYWLFTGLHQSIFGRDRLLKSGEATDSPA